MNALRVHDMCFSWNELAYAYTHTCTFSLMNANQMYVVCCMLVSSHCCGEAHSHMNRAYCIHASAHTCTHRHETLAFSAQRYHIHTPFKPSTTWTGSFQSHRTHSMDSLTSVCEELSWKQHVHSLSVKKIALFTVPLRNPLGINSRR